MGSQQAATKENSSAPGLQLSVWWEWFSLKQPAMLLWPIQAWAVALKTNAYQNSFKLSRTSAEPLRVERM